MSDNRDIWRKQHFERVRAEIRAELDKVAPSSPDGIRLQHALHQIVECQREATPESQLKQYIYAVSALLEHGRHRTLNVQTVRDLFQLAEKILRHQKLSFKGERHAYLYGDLYLIQSQIHRVEGSFTQALWEEQISNSLSLKASPERLAFQYLSGGIHLLRMGYAFVACQEFSRVDVEKLEGPVRLRWFSEYHSALRLSFQLEKAKEFAKNNQSILDLGTTDHRSEFEWEEMCRETQVNGNIDELMRSALPKKKFHEVPYVMEAFLISRTVQQKEWMTRYTFLPKTKKALGAEGASFEVLWKAALAIKDGYAQDKDYIEKLQSMSKIFSDLTRIRSIFHELLVRAALARWSIRRPSSMFARVSLLEYQTLSLKLTGGRTHDALNLMPDVAAVFGAELVPTEDSKAA